MIVSGLGFAAGEYIAAALILISSAIFLLGAAVSWVATALGKQAEIMKNSVNQNRNVFK